MIDKVLFLLLIILLPIGLIVAKVGLDAKNNPGAFTKDQESRINDAIKQLEETVKAPEANIPEFTITSTLIATESSEFRVSGIAPYENSMLVAKLFNIPTNPEDEVMLFEQIVQPSSDGSFIVSYDYAPEDDEVEIWLQQQDALYASRERITQLQPSSQ